jgi:hypothetical protein
MAVERVLMLITEQSSSFAYFNSTRLPVCGKLCALNVKIMDEAQRKYINAFLILPKELEIENFNHPLEIVVSLMENLFNLVLFVTYFVSN